MKIACLFEASRKGNLKIVEKLIESGANPEIPGMVILMLYK